MKKGILFLFLAAGFSAKAQSLKDALYSGKLKLDSTSVIRKGDDLSSKIDTATRKPLEPERPKAMVKVNDTGSKIRPTSDTINTTVELIDATSTSATSVTETVAPVKSNNKIWKDYTDTLISVLKTEVLTSKKIKKETYFLIVDYEIGADGAVNIINVGATPENEFLQQQVKDRLLYGPPQLAPVLDSSNKPRKVKRKHSFSVTKE